MEILFIILIAFLVLSIIIGILIPLMGILLSYIPKCWEKNKVIYNLIYFCNREEKKALGFRIAKRDKDKFLKMKIIPINENKVSNDDLPRVKIESLDMNKVKEMKILQKQIIDKYREANPDRQILKLDRRTFKTIIETSNKKGYIIYNKKYEDLLKKSTGVSIETAKFVELLSLVLTKK